MTSLAVQLPVLILVLVTASPMWWETDAYRVSAAALVLAGLAYYLRYDFWREDRPRIGWMGLACLAWTIHVLIRFAIEANEQGSWSFGSNEGIYLLIVLCPTFGYAMYRFMPQPRYLIAPFVFLSAVCLAVTLLHKGTLPQQGADILLFNNSIHAAAGLGNVLLISALTLIFARRETISIGSSPWPMRIVLAVITVLAAACVISLSSKGVWLALAITVSLAPFVMLVGGQKRRAVQAAVAMMVIVIAVGALGSQRIVRVAGDTASSVITLGETCLDADALDFCLSSMIGDDATPTSMRIRLELWADALDLTAQAPLFGHGPSWMNAWETRQHIENGFNLLHNGYLEIAVRYGLLGLIFHAFATGWALFQMWRAGEHGLLSPAVYKGASVLLIFYLGTLLTNSNIRLAVGESFGILFIATGFYCYYRLQDAGFTRPRTLI